MKLNQSYSPLDIEEKWYDFWMKEGFYREQPAVRFSHEMVLLLDGPGGRRRMWSTKEELNDFYLPNVQVPIVRSSQEDRNHDGLSDTLSLSVSMPEGGEKSRDPTYSGYDRCMLLLVFS